MAAVVVRRHSMAVEGSTEAIIISIVISIVALAWTHGAFMALRGSYKCVLVQSIIAHIS